ncbi:hypothetical protein [Microcoleus asticus]|nr:hypothetical protein [Microcoleus asticus]
MVTSSGAIDYFGVGKRHCRVLNILVVDGHILGRDRLFWGRETALPCPP